MNKKASKIFLGFIALFVLLFLGKLVFNLFEDRGGSVSAGDFGRMGGNSINQEAGGYYRKNYASSKIQMETTPAGAQFMEQKYERTSTLSASSRDFDADARKAMDLAEGLKALVQNENAYGLPGSRVLSLSFGVSPAGFEPLTEGLKAIGELSSSTVVKTDKTADFKVLEAKRLSLEKTRDGLRALKVPGAALSDLVSLETKILEIEGQIQELGVSLGDFDEVNSLCTVNYFLNESKAPGRGSRFFAALFEALGWSVLVFLGISSSSAIAFGAALLLALLIDKLRAYFKSSAGQNGT